MHLRKPFSDEQIRLLNAYQKSDFHEYTCPVGSTLIATRDGWRCDCCVYTQDWAHPHSLTVGFEYLENQQIDKPTFLHEIEFMHKGYVVGRDPEEWIGFDLDGTLAEYYSGQLSDIGKPIKTMVDRLLYYRNVLKIKVKIFTARVSLDEHASNVQIFYIRKWLEQHNLPTNIEVTCKKDFHMIFSYDDRVLTVQQNTGKLIADAEILRSLEEKAGE